MHDSLCAMKVKVGHLQKLNQSILDSAVQLNEVDRRDLVDLMTQCSKQVNETYSEDSFQKILWDQQKKASYSNSKAMRWHPLIIKWCLYLQHFSGSAYETLKTSGILKLPSQRTLRDYTHYIKSSCGFSSEVDNDLLRAADYHSLEEWQTYVGLIIDEIHIKEDLVYDKHTGVLIGFTALGDINDQLLQANKNLLN